MLVLSSIIARIINSVADCFFWFLSWGIFGLGCVLEFISLIKWGWMVLFGDMAIGLIFAIVLIIMGYIGAGDKWL